MRVEVVQECPAEEPRINVVMSKVEARALLQLVRRVLPINLDAPQTTRDDVIAEGVRRQLVADLPLVSGK